MSRRASVILTREISVSGGDRTFLPYRPNFWHLDRVFGIYGGGRLRSVNGDVLYVEHRDFELQASVARSA